MKLVATLVALMSLAFMQGCQSSMHYTIVADANLSTDQIESIFRAGDTWSAAVPGLELDYRIEKCSGDMGGSNVCIFMDNGTPDTTPGYEVLASTDWEHPRSATVHLWPDTLTPQGSTVFGNVVLHELGHAFTHTGMHIAPGNVMAPHPESVTESLTPADVDYFWSAR